jgi:hypothetical protein
MRSQPGHERGGRASTFLFVRTPLLVRKVVRVVRRDSGSRFQSISDKISYMIDSLRPSGYRVTSSLSEVVASVVGESSELASADRWTQNDLVLQSKPCPPVVKDIT